MNHPEPRALAFRALHERGCFGMPNPWDAGSARELEPLGRKALATTSVGVAWTMGRPDNGVTLEERLAHLRIMAAAASPATRSALLKERCSRPCAPPGSA